MSRTLINTLALGLALTISPAAFTRIRNAPRGQAELAITLRIYNYAQVPASDLAKAESGAAGILRKAGIETAWLDCALSDAELKLNPVCEHTAGHAVLWLKILPESMARSYGFSDTTMGFASLSPDGRRGSESFVSYRWVERLAETEFAPRHAILAHVMAHEIGHLLLGTNSHFPLGIMRADWTREDLQRICREGLQFTSQEAALMRQAVQTRIEHEMMIVLPEVLSAVDSHTEIPFKLYRDYTIIVQGSIGGLGKCNLLIDTGAVPSVVDRRVAKKLHLAGTAEEVSVFTQSISAQRVVLPDLQLGPIRAESVSVLVRDLSFIEESLGVRVDAMVGLDVLGRSDFSIDYAAKKLVFGPVEPLESEFAIQAGQGFVYATLQVQGQSVRLLVDTGANHLVLFDGRVQGRITGLRPSGTKTTSNLGGDATLKDVQLKEVRLGGKDFPTLEAFLLDNSGGDFAGLDGLLGVRSLGLTRLSFDFSRQTVSWK